MPGGGQELGTHFGPAGFDMDETGALGHDFWKMVEQMCPKLESVRILLGNLDHNFSKRG